MTDGGVLRCEAKVGKHQRRCGGPCGHHPVPVGTVVVFLRVEERCGDPDGKIRASCKACGAWGVWEIVGAVIQEPALAKPD